ncbi:MAG: hypothetical protein RIT27_1027 [Pseudomonadota bacterium]
MQTIKNRDFFTKATFLSFFILENKRLAGYNGLFLIEKYDMTDTTPTSSSEETNPPQPVEIAPLETNQSEEIGGPKGLEPTRYGDWEKGGRCIDF